MSDEGSAVEALHQLGLTEYEAKCFVALSRTEYATAKEISQLCDVPRSRVYDSVDRLHKRGLVDVQQSDPRKYRAVSKDEAFDKLRHEYNSIIKTADAALEQLESAKTQEETGMWAIADTDHVSDRVMALLDDADKHIHFIVVDETTLEQAILDRLATACDRGTTVIIEVPSARCQEQLQQTVSEAHIVVSPEFQETQKVVKKWPGQLVMVDHQAVLASGVEESRSADGGKETAVWSHGHDHGFAAWMRELLQDRSDRLGKSG